MMRLLAIAALLIGVPVSAASPRCDADRVKTFVGALGTSELGRAALTRARAKRVRWVAPGTMVTMDYSPERLNIRLDAKNVVTSLDCG